MVLGTGATDIMPDQGSCDSGTTINRARVPPGMLRGLPTFRNGHLKSSLVGACMARKGGKGSSGTRVDFLAINKVDCLGSAMEAVATGSMAKTTFPSTPKGAGP